MEKLLNKLIEKGWKPMGHKPLTDEIKKKVKVERYNRKPMAIVIKNGRKYADDYYSLREIVSIDSGLWQFVCEEGLVNYNEMKRVEYMHQGNKDYEQREYYNGWDDGSPKYEYRLIEASLKNEDELEQFLLENIKVE